MQHQRPTATRDSDTGQEESPHPRRTLADDAGEQEKEREREREAALIRARRRRVWEAQHPSKCKTAAASLVGSQSADLVEKLDGFPNGLPPLGWP